MAGTVLRLSADERHLLAGLDRVIAKELEHRKKLEETGAAGDAAGEDIGESFGRAARESEKALKGLHSEFRKAGPMGREIGQELSKHFAEAGKAGHDSVEGIIERMRQIDPAAADAAQAAADRIKTELAEADAQTEFDNALKQLRALGGDSAKIADQIRDDLVKADAEAAGDMDEVLAKLAKIRPEVAGSADKIKAELAEAAQFSEGKFEGTLGQLRKMGPVGKQIADGLKRDLVGAGKLSERSIEDVIDEIEKIDPAAAQAARRLHTEIDGAAQKGESSWKKFAESSVTQIASVVLAYASVSRVIQEVTGFMREQQELLSQSLDAQTRLATAQQNAAKNLAGLTAVERSELLQQAVPDIAYETGFSDVTQITTAIGTAVSSGATAEEAREAVRQSARVQLLNPDELDELSAGAVAVQRQTGLSDIRQAIALVQSSGSQSAVTDADKLVIALPKALTAIGTVEGQDKEEAARQIAAIFGQVTLSGNDLQGSTGATFTTKFAEKLFQFFGDIEKQGRDRRSELQNLESKKVKTEADQFRIDELKKLIPELEKAVDPGDLFGRIQALQNSEALRKEFTKEKFGEEQFQGFVRDIVNKDSKTSQNLLAAFADIQANADFFEQQAEESAALTPQQVVANAAERNRAAINASQAFDIEAATLGAVRQIYGETTSASRGASLDDWIEWGIRDPALRYGGLQGGTALEESVSAIDELQRRIRALEADGVTADELPRIEKLRGGVSALEQLISQLDARGLDPENVSAAAQLARDRAALAESTQGSRPEEARQLRQENIDTLNRIADLMEQQLEASRAAAADANRTANNTAPKPLDLDQPLGATADGADAYSETVP